jgi:hypothetical protein
MQVCGAQVEEAVGCYHRLQVATSLEGGENKLGLQGPRRAAIAQLGEVLKLRIQVCSHLALDSDAVGAAVHAQLQLAVLAPLHQASAARCDGRASAKTCAATVTGSTVPNQAVHAACGLAV